MINNKFELTVHARDQLKKRFPDFSFRKEIKSVNYCTKDEVCRLKQTESYKKIKKGLKYKYNFYRTDNDMYLVCETKLQKKGVYFNIVITVIDFKRTDYSLYDYEFNKESIEAAYRLEQAEKEREEQRLNPTQKVKAKKAKKKVKKSVEKDRFSVSIKTNEELLDKALHKLATKEMFSIEMTSDQVNPEKTSLVIFEMKKLNKSINKVVATNKELLAFEATGLKKHKNLAIQKIHAIDNFILKNTPTFENYYKEGFKDYYLDFVSFTLKRKTEIVKMMYNGGDLFPVGTYEKLYKSFIFYNDNFDKTESLQEGLDFLGRELLNHYKNKMTAIYKDKDYYVIRWDIEKAISHIHYIKKTCPLLAKEADDLISFFTVVEEMFYKLDEEKFYIQDHL